MAAAPAQPAVRRRRPSPIDAIARTARRLLPPLAWRVGPWLVPVVVWFAVRRLPTPDIQQAAAVLAGLGLVALIVRFPSHALAALIVWLPLQFSVQAWLFKNGVAFDLVRQLSPLRDVAVFGLAVAAFLVYRGSGRKLDALDKVALFFVAVAVAYLLIPEVMVRPYVGIPDFHVRSLAFRMNVFPIVLCLAARHLRFGPGDLKKVVGAVLAIGGVFAAVGLYEWLNSSGWNRFAVGTLGVNEYRRAFGEHVPYSGEIRRFTVVLGTRVVRPGSLLYEPVVAGIYLLIPFGVAVAMIARAHIRAVGRYLVAAAAAVVIIVNLTRAAQVGMVVAALVAIRVVPVARRMVADTGRARLAMVLILGLVLVVPIAASTSALDRLGPGGAESSDAGHRETLESGFRGVLSHPMGNGLGTNPKTGYRFGVPGTYTTHDSYLQVGIELGVFAMVAFVAFMVLVLLRLRRQAFWDGPVNMYVVGALASGVTLFAVGFVHHVWISPAIALTYWGVAGAILGAAERRNDGTTSRESQEPALMPRTSVRNS